MYFCHEVIASLPDRPNFFWWSKSAQSTWSIFLQFCILRSSSLKTVMSKWMKGEAQANAMSVCVCNKTKKITHWTLVVCYLSCALMCYFSYALVCYLSCAVLAITGRTSTCRCRVDCTLSIRSLLVLLHTQSGVPLYTRLNHRVRLHSTLGRSQSETPLYTR